MANPRWIVMISLDKPQLRGLWGTSDGAGVGVLSSRWVAGQNHPGPGHHYGSGDVTKKCGALQSRSLVGATHPRYHMSLRDTYGYLQRQRFLYGSGHGDNMNTIPHIDDIIEEKSLLKHQFYQMWSDGKLSQDMLAGYSKEYYQLVKAVPLFMETILPLTTDTGMLEANMQEEYEHIPLWEDFAAGLGVSKDELQSHGGLEETCQAIDVLHGLAEEYYDGAAAMYALEKEIPDISRTKMDGLDRFYGIHDKDTVQYFVQHIEADVRHAAEWRAIIESAHTKHDAMIRAAHTSMDAQNLLLDGCYNTYCDNK